MAHTKITTRNITDDAVTSAKLDTNIDIAGTLAIGGGLSIPSTITHVGDTDTKLDFNQANTMRLITGGNTAWIANASSLVINEDSIDFDFRVESNGNANMLFVDGGNDAVGIGTSSPDFTLDVEADKDTWLSRIYNTGSDANAQGLLVRSDGTAAHDALVMGVYADSGYKMVVRSTGYVGIGTTSPGSGLVVSGGNNLTAQMRLINTAPSPDNDWTIGAYYNDQTLRIRSNDNATTVMAMKDTGEVGISTGSPASLLDVRTTTGTMSHFGGIGTTDTHYTGISFGYSEAAASTYRKSAIVQEQIGDGAARGHMHFLTDISNDGNSVALVDSKMKIHGTTGYVIPRMNFHYALTNQSANLTTTSDEASSGAGVLILKQQISVNATSKIIVWADSGQITASSSGGYNPQMVVYVTSNSSAPPSRGESHGINSSTQHRWYPVDTDSSARLFMYVHGASGSLSPGTYYIYVYGGSYNGGSFQFNSQSGARGSSIVWAEVMV